MITGDTCDKNCPGGPSFENNTPPIISTFGSSGWSWTQKNKTRSVFLSGIGFAGLFETRVFHL